MAPNTSSLVEEERLLQNAKVEKGVELVEEAMISRGHARRMGHLENYFSIMQRQRMYTNFNMYAELSTEITRDELSIAIRNILLKHPIMMQSVIPKKYPDWEDYYTSDEYYNTPFPENDYLRVITNKVKLSDIIINDQTEDYGELIQLILDEYKKNNYVFDAYMQELIGNVIVPMGNPNKPNWRLLCLPTDSTTGNKWKRFVYISNHICSDAISSVNLFQDIAQEVTKLNDATPVYKDDVIVDYGQDCEKIGKLPVPITERIEYRPPLSKLPKIMAASFMKTLLNFKSNALETRRNEEYSVEKDIPEAQMGDVCFDEILNYKPEEVRIIRDKIKHNVHGKCTVTPFIQACFFAAMHQCGKLFGQKQGFKDRWLEWGVDMAIPSSTRRYLPEDPEIRDMYKYGSNVGGLHYLFLISSMNIKSEEKQKFWSLVEYYHDVLVESHNNGGQTVGLGTLMLDVIIEKKNVDKLIMDEYLYQKRGGVILSNAGYFHQDPEQRVHVTNFIFGQRPGALKFSFGVNIVSTNISGMNLNVGMVRHTLKDRKEFSLFIQTLDNIIRTFAGL
ncbi:Alcohol O-acetyltransferase 2 [Nakaseomyces bracarensis]|uniref:Alcohol O-acetyltransferase 2 n=1 Tax=Nakaseomyces bracarensis TaxID=273131 RepID=A0ABR4NTX2_9SACH